MKYQYPEPLKIECGCKVVWRHYFTAQEAQRASKVAEEEREERLSEGYDFGYQWPGDIRKSADGIYRVTCP